MAGHGHLSQLSAVVRTDALERLEALLPEDDAGREAEALQAAVRDVLASPSTLLGARGWRLLACGSGPNV